MGMDRHEISGTSTFLHKFVFPFIAPIYFLVLFFVIREPRMLLFVAIALLFFGAWYYFFSSRFMKVEMDETNFYISNFFREITVPRSDLLNATEMRALKPYWITLWFKNPTEFGEKILFVPKWRIGAFWKANPLVQELNDSRPKWSERI